MPTVPNCCATDLPAIARICGHNVRHGAGTFKIDPPTERGMDARRADVLAPALPRLVAEQNRELVGYACYNWFRPRPACRFSAEVSVYLDPQAQGRGLGRALLAGLVTPSERAGVHKLIAVIGDSYRLASTRLHQKLRFTAVGLLKSCGFKFERWPDVVSMDRAVEADW